MNFPINWSKALSEMEEDRNGWRASHDRLFQKNKKLRAALQKAVDDYGKPGGPWNVPSEPGAWLQMAKDALGGE